VILQLLLSLLLQRVLGDRLERLLDVDGLLCGSLEIRDVAFRLAPGHCAFLCYLYPEWVSGRDIAMCRKSGALVACSLPRRSYYPKQQRGSFRGRVDSLGSETRLSNCPMLQMTLSCSRHRPTRSSLRHGRKQRRETESVPGRRCPTTMADISRGMRARCSIGTDLHCD
jgi:hypothetical protein